MRIEPLTDLAIRSFEGFPQPCEVVRSAPDWWGSRIGVDVTFKSREPVIVPCFHSLGNMSNGPAMMIGSARLVAAEFSLRHREFAGILHNHIGEATVQLFGQMPQARTLERCVFLHAPGCSRWTRLEPETHRRHARGVVFRGLALAKKTVPHLGNGMCVNSFSPACHRPLLMSVAEKCYRRNFTRECSQRG